jgi:hypothetical protein
VGRLAGPVNPEPLSKVGADARLASAAGRVEAPP